MAFFTTKSRYAKQPVVYRPIYKDYETDPYAEWDRLDIVFTRRFTSYEPPTDSSTYVTKPGDTLQGLANIYYGDPQYWWVIADHNPDIFYPLELEEKTVLAIPHANSGVLS